MCSHCTANITTTTTTMNPPLNHRKAAAAKPPSADEVLCWSGLRGSVFDVVDIILTHGRHSADAAHEAALMMRVIWTPVDETALSFSVEYRRVWTVQRCDFVENCSFPVDLYTGIKSFSSQHPSCPNSVKRLSTTSSEKKEVIQVTWITNTWVNSRYGCMLASGNRYSRTSRLKPT